MSALRVRTDALDAERQDLQRRHQAVHRLEAFDWRGAFAELEEKLQPSIRERAKAASAATEKELDGLVDRWFLTDASLESLIKDDLQPRLARYETELATFVAETLEEEVRPGSAGVLLPSEIGADLHARVDMTRLGLDSLSSMDTGAVLGHARPQHRR